MTAWHSPLLRRESWLTWPNLITLVRLALVVPIVVFLIRGDHPVLTVALLVLFGTSDWVDGFLARKIGQVSIVGKLFDPVADRLGVAAIVLGFIIAGHLALWVGIVIVVVDVTVAVSHLVRGFRERPEVSGVGKIRTGVLMAGLAMMGVGLIPAYAAFAVVGEVIAAVGAVLHVVAGIGYVRAALTTRP